MGRRAIFGQIDGLDIAAARIAGFEANVRECQFLKTPLRDRNWFRRALSVSVVVAPSRSGMVRAEILSKILRLGVFKRIASGKERGRPARGNGEPYPPGTASRCFAVSEKWRSSF